MFISSSKPRLGISFADVWIQGMMLYFVLMFGVVRGSVPLQQ